MAQQIVCGSSSHASRCCELTCLGSPSVQAELSNPLEAIEHYCRSHLAFQRLAYSQVSPLTEEYSHGACTTSCRMLCSALQLRRYVHLVDSVFSNVPFTTTAGCRELPRLRAQPDTMTALRYCCLWLSTSPGTTSQRSGAWQCSRYVA
jgi:hypothetical protein